MEGAAAGLPDNTPEASAGAATHDRGPGIWSPDNKHGLIDPACFAPPPPGSTSSVLDVIKKLSAAAPTGLLHAKDGSAYTHICIARLEDGSYCNQPFRLTIAKMHAGKEDPVYTLSNAQKHVSHRHPHEKFSVEQRARVGKKRDTRESQMDAPVHDVDGVAQGPQLKQAKLIACTLEEKVLAAQKLLASAQELLAETVDEILLLKQHQDVLNAAGSLSGLQSPARAAQVSQGQAFSAVPALPAPEELSPGVGGGVAE
mmetsp:Transcript_13899/g.36041  ORF Transcript_13899/g.36041 Transcript_13899/m.36041 type:complete len:257 (+) Transcript_13899:37-807(+)